MASTTETGHAKNLANLDKLIDLTNQLGATYNPTNPQLTVSGLTTLKTQSQTDYNNWTAKYTTYKTDTNAREIAFEPIDKTCTSILNNIKTLDVPQQTIDDVSALVSKIHGERRKTTKSDAGKSTKADAGKTIDPSTLPPIVEDPTLPTTISVSQLSYDSISANFDKLIQQTQVIASYAPNEANIQVSNLQTLFTTLKTVNLNAITATNAVNLARNQRNLTFYGKSTGLFDIAKKVKFYIKQVYGATSPEYHQATAIKFSRLKLK